ncbi:MAG: CocE/NonD family hydrolase [Streptosporangiaceae bacterium]
MRTERAVIPLPDGAALAATLYLPDDPGPPVPALLEYLPYRKDDAMLARDHDLYSYLAGRGYAGARVDIRGTGRSGGTLPAGEYTETEQQDAEVVIAWLAAQPWCTGAVGMWGISWGGFNAIQVALRRPPALKAIIAVDASDDLFHDDVHYIDGLPHLDEYALMIDHLNMLPPAPDFPLDEAALARVDTEPWLISVLGQPRDGPFWRRGSLRPDYGRLTIPAFLIGGWYDGYRDSVPRMLAHVPAPVKALIGPWNHAFPHDAVPGPAIEWRADAVRWWDHWLKGIDTGIMTEPPVTVFVRHWHPPDTGLAEIPGRWRRETALPPDRTRWERWFCGASGSLALDPPEPGTRQLRYVPSAGVAAGHWWGELTPDQRAADAWSLTFDSAPLPADTEILGSPWVDVHGRADGAALHWFARLCDVAPDGTCTLVTGAGRGSGPDPLRDLVHTTDRVRPIELHATSWVFPAGHRIRLAISNALWPMIWPTPAPARATTMIDVGPGQTAIMLPVVPAAAGPGAEPAGPEFPVPGPPCYPDGVRPWGGILPVRWLVERDEDGTAAVSWRGASGTDFPWGRMADEEYLRYEVNDADPAGARARGEARTEIHLPGRLLTASSTLDLAGDGAALHYRFRRELRCDGQLVRAREWARRFPRGPW